MTSSSLGRILHGLRGKRKHFQHGSCERHRASSPAAVSILPARASQPFFSLFAFGVAVRALSADVLSDTQPGVNAAILGLAKTYRLALARLESYRFVGSRDEESRADVKGFGGSGVKSSPGLMN